MGHIPVVKVLLKAGAEINVRDDFGITPLKWASDKGHTDMVKILLTAGTNPCSKDPSEHPSVPILLRHVSAENY